MRGEMPRGGVEVGGDLSCAAGTGRRRVPPRTRSGRSADGWLIGWRACVRPNYTRYARHLASLAPSLGPGCRAVPASLSGSGKPASDATRGPAVATHHRAESGRERQARNVKHESHKG